MKHNRNLLIPLLIGIGAMISCSQQPAPDNWLVVPVASKAYDSQKGGTQIYSLNYDESKNEEAFAIHDEWITLLSNKKDTLSKWSLLGCEPANKNGLGGVIKDTLRVYTHQAPASDPRGYSLGLPDSVWIWNNSGPCQAILIDSMGRGVDTLRY